MPILLDTLDPVSMALALTAALIAGLVKGIVGFGMPTVMISLLGGFLSPELALAGLILPTLCTNGMQATRQGFGAALDSMRRFRIFLLSGLAFLLASAQLVVLLPQSTIFLLIGTPVTGFALYQLFGRPLVPRRVPAPAEALIGAATGFVGGVSGIWGPPTVMFLTAIGTEKHDQMRIQGVIYGLGAVALTLAHAISGVFTLQTAWLSAVLIPPAVLGMWLGGRVQDRIDQAAFRRATLLVLLLSGANLLRRGLFA